ncbi:DUF4135 domain-containing protein [Corynebacterium phocae]|uniref:DUF4135 domain-containing protein n=1 Tax=Corynebacterium phocae TaxID=161895 RepID=UPI001470EF33|nr:DUF4135 domain-containing protein [Corynebacterium phocae]
MHDSYRSSSAYHAVLSALQAAPATDALTVVRALGQAVAQSPELPRLSDPFAKAWESAWLSEGGQLLRRWVLAGQPGSKDVVALRATIVADNLYHALAEAQSWWLNDARKLGVQPTDLNEVRPGLGDYHGGHRSVMSMHTKGGHSWILRPSSGELESLIGRIIQCCGLSNVHTTVPILSDDDHSWYAYLQSPTGPASAQPSIMRDTGALLALGWALRAVDFHRGNIIIPSGTLTLVDSETFLQPMSAYWNSENERRWSESVLGVGVLPRRIGSGGPESIEVGMLLNSPPPNGRTPFPRPVLSASDDGTVVTSWDYSAPAIDDGIHLPSDPALLTPLAKAFVEGVDECRDKILQHKEAVLSLLLEPTNPDARIASRVILTPTYRYAQILRLLCNVISLLTNNVIALLTHDVIALLTDLEGF